MIGDIMNGPGAQMVPAVMLKYCADKQFNDQAITACAVALDIVGVVTGPGLITAALRAGRLAVAAFEAVQLLGAVGNLVANSSASPNLQAVVNKYNAIVGIWGLTRIATSGARYTADYFTAAKQNELSTITETMAQEYGMLYDAAKAEIDAASQSLKSSLEKMKKLVGRMVSGGGSALFTRTFISGINGFSDNITSVLAQRGLTLAEFKLLQQKRYDLMTIAEKSHIDAIRNSIPMPDGNTILQKVIPKNQIQSFIDVPNDNFRKVGGFVTTAKDAKHLNTFEDVYQGMRLDYPGTQFNISDGSFGVIRYKTPNPNLSVPKLPEVTGDSPYTGNGFTAGNNGKLGAPEWKSPYNTPNEGSELWEVFSDGTEVLRAKFSTSQNKFIPVP